MKLNEIKRPYGRRSRKDRDRLGRGNSSGSGGTSGKGHKGQKARSGGYRKVGFEGGQMPLQRRLPKRGFVSPNRKEYAIINLADLQDFAAGTEVTPEMLMESGKIRDLKSGLKVLGNGEIKIKLNIKAAKVSSSARKKIEAAGGTIVEVTGV
ncbi:MAG: 50S ribosomal protein L15 [Pseudomonadota bacterium]